jgi:hypothetical protein
MKALNGTIISLVAGAILVTGCGTSNTKQYTAAPNGFVPSSTVSTLSSQAQTAIFGNYKGTLTATDMGGGNDGSQTYTLTLGQAQIQGNSNTYVNMTLSSPGDAVGTVSDSELLEFNQAGNGSFNGDTRYVFYTTPHIISGLSNTAVQLEIDIYLNSANQVDSSQSQIVIYNCGFDNTCSTDGQYTEAAFSNPVKQ